MRKNLLAAVALAPLCLVASRETALATDTVTNGVNAPIATATATNGAPDDIDITTGSVSISSATPNAVGITPAVTINSSNSVTNGGSISITGVNNSAGILITNPYVQFGTIDNTGSITNGDSYSPTTNSNGLTEAPFASPSSTGRYGIRLIGPSGFVGDITNSGTITVNGDASAAISIEVNLAAGSNGTANYTGGIYNSGTISYTGDNGAAIQITKTGSLTGPLSITGAVSSLGTGSKAIDIEGEIGGRFSVYSSITSTGYASTTRPVTTSSLQNVQSISSQVQQSGGAVIVNGSVNGGIFIGSPPVGTTTSTATTTDLDGDGVPDVGEGVGTIVNYGSAPALSIGNAASPNAAGIVIGVVGGTDTTAAGSSFGSTNNYGLIVEGSVSGAGIYDGVTATGLQIGSGGTGPVTVTGGVRVVGSISADSYLANATAINVLAGATVPEIRNEDFVESSVSTSAATGTNLAGTSNPGAVSTGISIAAGAKVSTLNNYGTLQATANGDTMKAIAVVDASGSLSTVLNQGVISAAVTPLTAGLELATGTATVPSYNDIALDLRNNTTGVTLTQSINPHPVSIEVSTTTSASGVVTTTASLTTVTSSTTTTTTTTTAGVTTTTTTTTPTYPQIVGDVLLGNGTNTVSILGGSVTGALSLGGGTGGSLTLDNGAIVSGPVTFSGTGLAVNVNNGTLFNTSPTQMNLSSLTVGSKGVLYAAINPSGVQPAQAVYNVSGAATLASGAQLGIFLNAPLYNEQTFTLIKAGSLSDATGGALAANAIPFVVTGMETSNAATGTVSIDLRLKTTAELGLNPAEAAAFKAIYAALPNDAAIESAVLNQYTKNAFLGVYDQLLPDYAGGLFELALSASDAVTRATSRVNDIANPSGTRGAWAEEVAFGVNKNRSTESAGYQGGGFGFVGGLETGGFGLGAFGLTGSFLTGDIKDPHAPGENLQSFSEGEGGAYWQGQLGGFRGDARVGAGYMLYADRRELLLTDASGNTTLDRAAKGSSNGYTFTGHVGVGYQTPQFGWFYFRPQVHGDYFRLQENGFTEHNGAAVNGADAFDLAFASKSGNETSGTASLVTGMTFGSGFQWRPELEVGYRDVFQGEAGDTTAHFAGGQPFTLQPDAVKGAGPVARVNVKADTDFYELNFEAGVEQRTHFDEGDLRISVRVLF